jgi:hypothetical protein
MIISPTASNTRLLFAMVACVSFGLSGCSSSGLPYLMYVSDVQRMEKECRGTSITDDKYSALSF